MLCKDNMASLDYKSKKNNAKHIFHSFSPFFIIFYFLKRITKTTYHEMRECYVMQILKNNSKEEWSQRVER